MRTSIGIDIGGTKILIGIVTECGEILRAKRYPMQRQTQQEAENAVFTAAGDFMSALTQEERAALCGIGVGAAGHISYDTGTWLQCYNIPISVPIPVARRLSALYGLPVKMDNDVHCATLGEYRFGRGKNTRCMVYINVGTGIAAGCVHEGMLIRGADNYAGEVGYLDLNCDHPYPYGRLEPVASGGGLIEQALSLLDTYPESALHKAKQENALHSARIFKEAQNGDKLAQMLAARAVRFLSGAVCGLLAIFNPDTVVFGGGASKSPGYMEALFAQIQRDCVPETFKGVQFLGISELNADNVGLLGAAALVMQ